MEQQRHHHGRGHRHEGAVLSIDACAYASAIRGWSPYYKAGLAGASLLLCIALDSVCVSAAVLLAMTFLTVGRGRLPLRRYLSLLSIPLTFLLLGGIAVALNVSAAPAGEYRLHLGFFCLSATRESIALSLRLTLKALGAVSALYMLTLSTPAGEVIEVLRSLRVPKLVIELMNMIYRYIFILMDTQCRMRAAAAARLGYCDYRTALSTFGRTASQLLVVSLRQGTAYYQALTARCYDGELRFLTEEKAVGRGQLLWAAVFLAALMVLWRIGG